MRNTLGHFPYFLLNAHAPRACTTAYVAEHIPCVKVQGWIFFPSPALQAMLGPIASVIFCNTILLSTLHKGSAECCCMKSVPTFLHWIMGVKTDRHYPHRNRQQKSWLNHPLQVRCSNRASSEWGMENLSLFNRDMNQGPLCPHKVKMQYLHFRSHTSTFFYLGKFLKCLADDQSSSITKRQYLLYKTYVHTTF